MNTTTANGYTILEPFLLAGSSVFKTAEKMFFIQTNHPSLKIIIQATSSQLGEGLINKNTVAVFHIKPKKRKAIVSLTPALLNEQWN